MKNTNIEENIWICERAERASLEKCSHFHILKRLFPLIFCWYFSYFVSETCIFSGIKLHLAFVYTINAVLLLHNGMALCINDRISTKHWNCGGGEYVRASGASELRKFWHFYILKVLFLLIFCRYFRYFVGTNGMLVGLHVPTNFQMYLPTKLRKGIIEGGGNCPPAPLATLVLFPKRVEM